ncbi:GlsB/YeaQ/YmgE family stress response membrane protein [Thermoflavifilum sp.]|uniref:GlsB/YeaQ/YmgE family stress response membrane protein n=1 Tax=Thermoflavifilum sp. TaxID=1968839 RepID=UPI0025F05478|nr:GlsB/YeaQ/YmgE family stress response membrane protein [Thermoflavifilum sp.]
MVGIVKNKSYFSGSLAFFFMTLGSFLVLLLIAAICGAIGQSLAGYNLGGCLVSLIVGLIGAYIGTWLAAQLHLPVFLAVRIQGETFPVVWAVIGSAIFTFIVALLRNLIRKA